MGLNFCEGCQCLEGNVVEEEDGTITCAECGEEVNDIPEHDEGDDR